MAATPGLAAILRDAAKDAAPQDEGECEPVGVMESIY
jgi:hypothetical protein